MGDSLDDMIALKQLRRIEARKRKQANLAMANLTGWRKLSDTHYRRALEGGGYVDWWPTTRKFAILGIGNNQYRARYRLGDPVAFIAKHPTLSFVGADRNAERDHWQRLDHNLQKDD